jgi:hypothetical protein
LYAAHLRFYPFEEEQTEIRSRADPNVRG